MKDWAELPIKIKKIVFIWKIALYVKVSVLTSKSFANSPTYCFYKAKKPGYAIIIYILLLT